MRTILYSLICLSMTFLLAEGKTLSPADQAMQKDMPQSQSSYTISEVLGGGRIIVLNDGSQWEVHPDDMDKSGGWLGPADVVLSPSTDSTYKYQLFNDWTNSAVRVRPYTLPSTAPKAPAPSSR